MNFLEERIVSDGAVSLGNVLKVDSFLNHQIDVSLLLQVGKVFYDHFKGKNITRVITVESSGIAVACFTAQLFQVPVVYAVKEMSKNLDGLLYKSHVYSSGGDRNYDISLSRRYLDVSDTVLIVDDFLASGVAVRGLLDICSQAGAKVAGIGVAIEKGFQGGGDALRHDGYDVKSVAIVDSMSSDGTIVFREQPDEA